MTGNHGSAASSATTRLEPNGLASTDRLSCPPLPGGVARPPHKGKLPAFEQISVSVQSLDSGEPWEGIASVVGVEELVEVFEQRAVL